MKAWIYEGKVQFILPSEADPDTMGKIYDLKWYETQTYYDMESVVRSAQQAFDDYNRRLTALLIREQGE